MTRPSPTILMCRPTYFGIKYEINPWMKVERDADPTRAIDQWERLTSILRELGATIEFIEPRPEWPDMVFTANAGIVHGREFVPAQFRHPERQGETPLFTDWAARHGFSILTPGDSAPALRTSAFEGAGDALYCGDTLFAGYLNRSDIGVHRFLSERFQCRVVSLELVDPHFYHLDTCFCPLAPGVAIYFPSAFDNYGQRALRESVPELIAVEEANARRFGCNAVVVGKNVVLNAGCDALKRALAERGYTVHETDLSEFLKSGGSAKCLTLRLDGEEAATW